MSTVLTAWGQPFWIAWYGWIPLFTSTISHLKFAHGGASHCWTRDNSRLNKDQTVFNQETIPLIAYRSVQARICHISVWKSPVSLERAECRRNPGPLFTNTPFTQGLQPLCLPCATTKLARSPLKAEGRPNGCRGRSRVAHRTFRHRNGRHGRREVLSMFKTVAQRSLRRSVAHRSLKGGRMKAHTSPWSQNGCTVVGNWSPSKKCEHCVSIWATRLPSLYHHCASFGRPMASIERSLWRPLCLYSATTATYEPPWQWFCRHSAFFARPVVPLQQLWSFKEGTGVVLQQLHRNRTFWVPATTERPNHFYGHTKVARRSQPCVKEALADGRPTTKSGEISKPRNFRFRLFQSLWNLTGTPEAALPRCLPNFRATE